MRRFARVFLTLLATALAGSFVVAQEQPAPTPAPAQRSAVQTPILTIDTERLFSQSAFGLRVAREIEERGAALSAENRSIEAELGAEEQELTEKRSAMEPGAFRVLADAFDQKVQDTRRAQEAKGRELSQLLEKEQIAFLNTAAPILESLMRDSGAGVILERRSVFLSANAIDITDAAIARINTALGDGAN
ncbi:MULTISPECIES: OmpH family outer membrane protein [Roseobacteraceae]|jgi:Skp family chaperone for outer membrane proteins|uniref:Outer membrane protein (OmpH-like) n=1 Tax=Pseudosulfitobacter pseudonitzschiae TaxID=1402135 RepID=A0A221K0J4_9RHOB|nr:MULTISPECIES: OmpH family outer membrane protein [Roseobacteraceae]ASM72515.1 outer membrane protein (OmpH-like) [Pseudosulfitobacter pseudonitzschiae]